MRIEGAGGCFDNRIYELDKELAWKITLLSVNEMGVTVDEIDQALKIIKFHNKDKIMQVAIQSLDEESVHVIMDATKERLQIYSGKKETKEVELFYELFERKLREFQAFILCPECGEKISSLAKFCPECGAKIK